MALRFEFSGGIAKPTFHRMEKFLLFFLVGGREVPLYQMLQDNLVVKLKEKGDEYQTSNNVLKLFVMQTGYGLPKRYHSFYFRLLAPPNPVVTIRPFLDERKMRQDFFFRGMCRFLTQAQVLDLLSEESESRRFVARQSPLPLDTLRSMVTVDKTAAREGVRCIRLAETKNG